MFEIKSSTLISVGESGSGYKYVIDDFLLLKVLNPYNINIDSN